MDVIFDRMTAEEREAIMGKIVGLDEEMDKMLIQ